MVQYDVPASPILLRIAPGQTLTAHYALNHVGNHMIVHVGATNFTFINTGNEIYHSVIHLFMKKKSLTKLKKYMHIHLLQNISF